MAHSTTIWGTYTVEVASGTPQTGQCWNAVKEMGIIHAFLTLPCHLCDRLHLQTMPSHILLLARPLLVLLGRHGPQLKRVYAPFPGEVLLQQLVDQPVPLDLRLVPERARRDHDAEVRLRRRAVGHGPVVLVEVRVVVDLEARRHELVGDLPIRCHTRRRRVSSCAVLAGRGRSLSCPRRGT